MIDLSEVPPIILTDDNPLLRQVSRPVEDWSTVTPIVRRMMDALALRDGSGLSAVQVGILRRVLVIRDDLHGPGRWLVMVNPTLDRTLNRPCIMREGCLSIAPRKWGDVARPAKCDATWFDMLGDKHSATLTGLTARVFQHEFDHLNGVLMTDRMVKPFVAPSFSGPTSGGAAIRG